MGRSSTPVDNQALCHTCRDALRQVAQPQGTFRSHLFSTMAVSAMGSCSHAGALRTAACCAATPAGTTGRKAALPLRPVEDVVVLAALGSGATAPADGPMNAVPLL